MIITPKPLLEYSKLFRKVTVTLPLVILLVLLLLMYLHSFFNSQPKHIL